MPEKSAKTKRLELLQARERECDLIQKTSVWREMEQQNDADLTGALNSFALADLPEGADASTLCNYFMGLRAICAAAMKLKKMFRDIKEHNVQELNLLLDSARPAATNDEDDLDAGETTLY